MPPDVIETQGHTSQDGMLHLDIGIADVDVTVTIRVLPAVSDPIDANGWPVDYFKNVAGSMPELERASQDEFEERPPLE